MTTHLLPTLLPTVPTIFSPTPTTYIPIIGNAAYYPVHRVYCVGRNYIEHAQEMGFTGREAPFFFIKPADTLVPVLPNEIGQVTYPSLTHDYQHEVELVIALGKGGRNININSALDYVYGYAVGLDMTRRDLQNQMKQAGRPWCIGKAFEQSAPIGAITPAAQVDLSTATITLSVNGDVRQHSALNQLIWSVPEIIAQLSLAWDLKAGDLIYTGTPKGVAAVETGDILSAQITRLAPLNLSILPANV